MTIPISILDLAPIASGQTVRQSFANSVRLAQTAEANGYSRVWYAEHHNMTTIASSATSVLIGHVADHTSTIRLGSGGVMLPNHSPLAIAEQFGTLAELHPGRIDLGLGRAPGSDQNTARAMRRDPRSSEQFPQDVLELQAFLRGESIVPGVQAVPGGGTDVPLYILGHRCSERSSPPLSDFPLRSPRTSRPTCSMKQWPCTATNSVRHASVLSPTRSLRST